MKIIQVFDPALCCSTGVCGVDVDQQLVDFSADVDWAKQNGAQIERFNLAQQPLAFAENKLVKSFLEQNGADCLPLIVVDGAIRLAGRYPNRDELWQWTGIETPSSNPVTPQITELIALGAAIAASCEPCFKFHYDKARKLGVSADSMQEAVEIGEMVKLASTQNILDLAGRILNKSSADNTVSACSSGTPSEKKPATTGGCCN
jgi:AhpD family alkylhydroperoxidase